MLKNEMIQVLNEQLNKEFYSAYKYLGMSAFASSKGFNGVASWFFTQYQEENAHGLKLYRYLDDQGAQIDLKAIKAVSSEYSSIMDAFQKALAHERVMTESLNDLSDQALTAKDHATYNLLQWYVLEQVEEEAIFGEIIDKLNIVGDNGPGLYSIDKELGSRQFVDPTA